MDYMNSTCDYIWTSFKDHYHECVDHISCSNDTWASFVKSSGGQIWQVNALLVVNAIVTAAIVGIGAYGQRFRHHPFTRLLFLGANTLFLPIISYVVSTSTSFNSYVIGMDNNIPATFFESDGLAASCSFDPIHMELVVTLAFLAQVAVINTSVVVATDDREGHNIGPPFQLLVQGVWTFYLGISAASKNYYTSGEYSALLLLFEPFALLCAKMVFKYYAYKKAQQSFALGRNPRLISGYMKQLQLQDSQHSELPTPHPSFPPLLVMGEEGRKVEKKPHGYVFKDDLRTNNTSLVTIDRIWQLDNMLPLSRPHLKDLFLSFAFFKLLRCRFARYEPSNVGSIAIWRLMLEDGGHTRVFGVVADELSFLHDYYNTSLPISFSKGWLPILSVGISFVSIGYCIAIAYQNIDELQIVLKIPDVYAEQIKCEIWCTRERLASYTSKEFGFGSMLFDLVPIYLLFILVVMSEVRDICSYICSNWTKVALICHYVSRQSSPPRMPRWAALQLNCNCKMMKHWNEKIGQCSVLELNKRTALFVHLKLLHHLPERKTKVKVSPAVKVCIIDVLRGCKSSGRRLSNGTTSLRQIHHAGESLLWACNGEGTSDIILAWHIATNILQVRYPSSISDHKTTATQLSRYCVYLMTTCPELLPDDDKWSKSLYKAVKKDAARAVTGSHVRVAGSSPSTPEAKVQKLVTVLERESKHEVLKNGARLGKQLVEMMEEEETKWKLLAGFWSEMILYIAPSDNLKGHSEAIARGGELITLLWAMLTHAGIINSSAGGTGDAHL